jgi:competence protein ComEC
VGFEILWPDGTEGLARNDRSCVLRIETAGGAVLLPGDIERPAEVRLVGRAAEKLRAEVLVLAHHGSRSSSTRAFLDAVQPTVAVISSGYLNRFGHPHPEVIEAVAARRIAIRDTRTGGALRIRMGRRGFEVQAYRQSHGRYFHSK